jgi:hypothetical protein
MQQATFHGNEATFVTSDRNMQVRLIASAWYSLGFWESSWIHRTKTIPLAVLSFLGSSLQITPPKLKRTNPANICHGWNRANVLQVEGVAKLVASTISRLPPAVHCLRSLGRTEINVGLSRWVSSFLSSCLTLIYIRRK